MADSFSQINPRDIVINRELRQRQEGMADVEDLKQSIKTIGIIHPIIIRNTAYGPTLVAGERRLTAALQLDLSVVPVRFFEELSDEEAEEIELEENAKRKSLSWRDQVRATGRLHELYRKKQRNWRIEQTAERISVHPSYLRRLLHVFEALDSNRIANAESIDQAYNTLQRFGERRAESIVGDIIVNGAALFGEELEPAQAPIAPEPFTFTQPVSIASDVILGEAPTGAWIDESATIPEHIIETILPAAPAPYVPPTDPIIQANFAEWARTYNGPKFTLVHCDFPYGTYRGGDSQGALGPLETEEFYANTPDVYWNLLDVFTANLDRFMSYSAHLVFWFDMTFYAETVSRLRRTGLTVHDHPLIWHKTGGPGGLGVAPGTVATHPRRTYDTALVAVRGGRPLVRSMCNSYAAPTVGGKIHPSQKPEPMLRYFLQMFVDETSTVLDPTCGSAAALRACEDLGAKAILGLELDQNYATSANTQTLKARILRKMGTLRKEETL